MTRCLSFAAKWRLLPGCCVLLASAAGLQAWLEAAPPVKAGVKTIAAKTAPAKPATSQPAETASKPAPAAANPVDTLLAAENAGVTVKTAPVIDDLAFLRRIYIDIIGRIPTVAEIEEFQASPSVDRRTKIIDKLLADGRFADRWTVFYADMLRLRSNAEGGNAFLAFVHQATESGMPYDEMCRQLIVANGKANYTPQVGFILGDQADPMALAGVTSQTFMGIRIACAQCHDHPFDKWTREEFYGLAAYFGKTRRIENQFTNTIFTTEGETTTVLWPPEGVGAAADRKPMQPAFPFDLDSAETEAPHIARFLKLRAEQERKRNALAKKDAGPSLEDLVAEADKAVQKATAKTEADETGVTDENQKERERLKLLADRYRESEQRRELAEFITNPRNRYFSRSFVNRVWAELVGRGFVQPIDDFSDGNQPSHPKTLDYLADEFVASGYDLKSLVRNIVTSEAYQRGHIIDADEQTRMSAEAAFAATPMRRMLSEVLYDSIVLAGHLFTVKHEAGKNEKIVWQPEQMVKNPERAVALARMELAKKAGADAAMAAKAAEPAEEPTEPAGYDLEKAIELDFNAVLTAKEDEPKVDQMKMVSKEELEAQSMARNMRRPGVEYIDRYVKRVVDDNPQFSTAMRMATPAPPSHFLRIFGQPTRDALGDFRDYSATMRQALMMLNGRLTHEAARVGELEPVYPLISAKKPDVDAAVALIYRELLTREATADEIKEGKQIVSDAGNPLDGIADLRWVLFNCHEFRFIP